MHHRRAAWLVLLSIPLAASAEIDGNLPMSDQLELYRARCQVLERELRVAKAELALAKKQLAELRATTRPAEKAPAPGAPADSGPRVFRSAAEFFRELPKELRRPPGGWNDSAASAAALDWVIKNARGKQFQGTVKLAGAKIAPNPARAKDETAPKWVSIVTFRPETSSFEGIRMTYVLQGVGEQALGTVGDTDVVRQVNEIRPGSVTEVTGTVDDMTVGHIDGDQAHVVLHLRDFRIVIGSPSPLPLPSHGN